MRRSATGYRVDAAIIVRREEAVVAVPLGALYPGGRGMVR